MSIIGQFTSGKWQISLVSAGSVKMDGGAIFGVVPKPLWEQRLPADAKNRVTLAMNCLVAQCQDACVVIETGFGGKVSDKMREIIGLEEGPGLLSSLNGLGIQREHVTDVILTHLHQDHAGGCTREENGVLGPTFPNATYHIQKGEWEDALNADAQTRNGYQVEQILHPLGKAGCVAFLNGDAQIRDGISVFITPGHTKHHQSILIETGDHRVCFVGDLIPTTHHLKPIYILAYDLYPRQTFLEKQKLMERSHVGNWIMAWAHDLEFPWGRLEKDEKGLYVNISLDCQNKSI